MLYRIAKAALWIVCRLFFAVRVEGLENIPAGPIVVCANHSSFWDPPLVGISLPRHISFMAKEELFRIPVLGWLLPRVQAFPVARGRGDRGAIRHSLRVLQQGDALGIFPEGRRVKTGEDVVPQTGAAFISLRADVPVVPVAVVGNYRFRQPMTVRFGKPVDLEEYRGQKLDNKILARVADKIMEEIRALIEKRPV